MKYPYTEYETGRGRVITRPTIPITFEYNKISIPVIDALVDTGADQTLLPLQFALEFGFKFNLHKDGEVWSGAGGGKFRVFPSPKPIHFIIPAQKGFRAMEWDGDVFFTINQPTILLGHRGCLENLNLTFKGKQKVLEIIESN